MEKEQALKKRLALNSELLTTLQTTPPRRLEDMKQTSPLGASRVQQAAAGHIQVRSKNHHHLMPFNCPSFLTPKYHFF